jgi:CRISPR system Cascade subunit CasD
VPEYLTFALVAPIAAFGSVAVGERRQGWDRPGRSAILGLVGACLGVEREDDMGQAVLATEYGVALLCYAPGVLLADYHTAQVPSAQRNRRSPTRAAELRATELNTILSRRDYRTGAWHLAALWSRVPAARFALPAVAAAMQSPVFVPYLGRKSCPLGLPLAPRIDVAEGPTEALLARHANGPEARFRPVRPAGDLTIALDETDAATGEPRLRRIEVRRDQPRSRRLWQFDLRREAILNVPST